jgi:hypothetical protein
MKSAKLIRVGELAAVLGSPAGEFDAFLPKAEKVIETVEWKVRKCGSKVLFSHVPDLPADGGHGRHRDGCLRRAEPVEQPATKRHEWPVLAFGGEEKEVALGQLRLALRGREFDRKTMLR